MSFDRVEILRVDESHIDEVAPLFDDYRVFYEQPSDPEAARGFLLERLRTNQSIVFLAVGFRDEERVPLGFTQLFPSFSSVSMKRQWILNDLFVAPAGRRQGVGRLLIDRARDLAVDTNAAGIILETALDNTPAQALYDSYGFVKDTEFFRYALKV